MNGPFALPDDEFDKLDRKQEAYITDYSIGKAVIYMGFAWSLVDEAETTVRELIRRHKTGFYNPGSGEVLFPDDLKKIRMRTQNDKDLDCPLWEDVWRGISRLSKVKGEFVVLDEATPTGKIAYLQALYFPDKRGEKGTYRIEVQLVDSDDSSGMPQYSRDTASFAEVVDVFRDWFVWGLVPDFNDWNDAAISPPPSLPQDGKNERINKNISAGFLVVGGVIVIGVISYFVWLFVS